MLFRIFHRQSGLRSIPEERERIEYTPPPSKEYERFPRIALPNHRPIESPLTELIESRGSSRQFDPSGSISLENVSDVLFTGLGVGKKRTQTEEGSPHPRHHPSGGSLYPIDAYLVSERVDGLEKGAYHYSASAHVLSQLIMSPSDTMWSAFEGTTFPVQPAALIVLTSVWGRTYPKYGEFAYRLALMEAGHVMQNLLLAAAARSLKACPAAGFRTEIISAALDIERDEEDPLYILLLGS